MPEIVGAERGKVGPSIVGCDDGGVARRVKEVCCREHKKSTPGVFHKGPASTKLPLDENFDGSFSDPVHDRLIESFIGGSRAKQRDQKED